MHEYEKLVLVCFEEKIVNYCKMCLLNMLILSVSRQPPSPHPHPHLPFHCLLTVLQTWGKTEQICLEKEKKKCLREMCTDCLVQSCVFKYTFCGLSKFRKKWYELVGICDILVPLFT